MKLSAAIIVLTTIFLAFPCFPQLEFVKHTIDNDFDFAVAPNAADIDGDGDLDIIGAAWYAEPAVQWWVNDGNYPPQFSPAEELEENFTFAEIVQAVDFDFDGDIDILAMGNNDYRNGLKYWENDGQQPPSFTMHLLYELTDDNNLYNLFSVADFDGDEDSDIVTASYWWYFPGPEYVRMFIVLENIGDLEFEEHFFETAANENFDDLLTVDLDGDNDNDVVFIDNGIKWMENQGDYNFEETVIFGGGAAVSDGDVDSDGDTDLIRITHGGDRYISWFENDGQQPPEFTQHIVDEWIFGFCDIIGSDLDLDGDMDIIEGEGEAFEIPWGDLNYYLNDGEQNFTLHDLHFDFVGPIGPNCLKTTDLDGDGDYDVISAEAASGEIAWFENRLIHPELMPFHLLQPETGTNTPENEIVLIWQSTSNAVGDDSITYDVYISINDPNEHELIASTADTAYLYTGEIDNTYFWDIKARSNEFELEQWAEEQYWHFTIVDTTNAVNDPFASSIPTEFAIQSVYPNPFNASTTIIVALPQPSYLSLQIFNTTGQMVSSLAKGQYGQGYHDFVFNGSGLSSGIYFVQASVPGKMNELRKVVLMK